MNRAIVFGLGAVSGGLCAAAFFHAGTPLFAAFIIPGIAVVGLTFVAVKDLNS